MTTKNAPRATKKAQLIRMLSAKAGGDIATISDKLGWLAHTTRAAITGLRKAGYEVTTEKPEDGKPTRYRITAEPPPADSAVDAVSVLSRLMPGSPDPSRSTVLQDWEEAFASPPPPYLSVAFMRKAVAHEAQCKRHGGLLASTRRALRQVAEGKPAADSTRQIIRSGAHLVREWNGRTYQVEVVDGGFRMDGRMWPSLSAIAKHITGTTWSGPRFFGLTDRSGGAA